MENKFKLPKKYWIYFSIAMLFGVILFVNIFVFDHLTGEKEFRDYSKSDIILNLLFLGTELLYFAIIFLFALKCGNIFRGKTMAQRNAWYDAMYSGIKRGDYDYVWFDYEDEQRALVMKNGDSWRLYVEKYNDKTELWEAINTASAYDSLTAIKKALFSEYDFYFNENAAFDERGECMIKINSEDNRLSTFEISDMWLLLSIGFSKKGSALAAIIKTGDYLNHAIFTLDELNYGMSKLIFNGYVKKQKEHFLTTPKAKSFYKTYKKIFENPPDEILRLSYLFQYKPRKNGCNLVEYFNEDEYNQALHICEN